MNENDTEFEAVAFQCLERLEVEGEGAVDEICRAHPDLEARIRTWLDQLQRLGLVDAEAVPPLTEFGEYRILRRLGGGGMGVVFLAEHQGLQRPVALKLMRPGFRVVGEAHARFRREIAAISKLDHPGICTVYEAGEIDGTPYLAMRYVEGETLAKVLQRRREEVPASLDRRRTTTRGHGSRELIETLELVEKIARALHAAHEQGVVHRDIKPANIVIGPGGQPVILDFGLARPEEVDKRRLTASGEILGTPAYMAPEQVSGGAIDRRTDVYALGVTLYECLTLRSPFVATTRENLYRQILTEEPPDPRRRNRHVGRELRVVLGKAMDKNPTHRFASCLEFAEELRRIRAHEPIRTRPPGVAVRTVHWVQRNPTAAAMLGTLVLALATSIFFQLQVQAAYVEAEAAGLRADSRLAAPHDPRRALKLALDLIELEETERSVTALHHALTLPVVRHVYRGHDGAVAAIDVTPDGKHFVSGSDDGRVCWWRTEHEEPVWTDDSAREAKTPIERKVGFVGIAGREANRIVGASWGGQLRLWDRDGTLLDSWISPERKRLNDYAAVTLSPDRTRVLAGFYGAARLFSIENDRFELLAEDADHADYVGVLAFSPDGQQWVAGTGDRGFGRMHAQDCRLNLWRTIPRGAELVGCVERRQGLHEGFMSVAFSPCGNWLAAGAKGPARIHDLRTGSSAEIHPGGGRIGIVCLQSSGMGEPRFVTTAWADSQVCAWDPSGRFVASAGRLERKIFSWGSVSDDRTWGVLCGEGIAFAVDARAQVLARLGHSSRVCATHCLPVGRQVLTGTGSGTIRLWSFDDNVLERRDSAVTVVQPFPDGTTYLTAQVVGEARVWTQGGPAILRSRVFGNGLLGETAAIAPGGRYVATCFRAVVSLWDQQGQGVGTWDVDPQEGTSTVALCFLSDHELLAWNEYGYEAPRIWDFASNTWRPAGVAPFGRAVASADGERLLTIGAIGRPLALQARLYRRVAGTGDWQESLVLERARAGALSPSGDRILLGTTDGRILVFDGDGRRLGELVGHGKEIQHLTFSADGRLFASASKDGTVRLWSVDGKALAVLEGPPGVVYHASFSPDGRYLLTGHEDGTVRRWFVRTEDMIDEAHRRHRDH